jgi:hypothetical protein
MVTARMSSPRASFPTAIRRVLSTPPEYATMALPMSARHDLSL